MGGGWQTYRCDRCPLVIEFGAFTTWDEAGAVTVQTLQVACKHCGTLHRLTEEPGICRVEALPGPVREGRRVTETDIAGEKLETLYWFVESDWQPVGQHPSGFAALDRLACRHCGQSGVMVTHEAFLYPEGYTRGAMRRQDCPVCHGPMECVAVTDAI